MGGFGVMVRAMLAVLLLAAPAAAQEPAEQPWQAAITAQIEAFRAKDAQGAFEYAAAPFQTAFPSAEAFFATIVGSGYGPIMESSGHSFGTFHPIDDRSVAQQVTLTGKDLSRYEAIYIMTEEEPGWRVSGVQLAKQPGLGV